MHGNRVAILVGSESDRDSMSPALEVLEEAGVECALHVTSAHRDPEGTREIVRKEESLGCSVFIGAAGLAAALPGYIASLTDRPVIGVPIAAGPLRGIDALLAIVQMPKGVPVATVGIGSAGNAALLALRILRACGTGRR